MIRLIAWMRRGGRDQRANRPAGRRQPVPQFL